MKKITGKLNEGIVGPGFTLRRGSYTGEMDDNGVIWVPVQATDRMQAARIEGRKVGVHVSRFAYLEEASPDAVISPKAEDQRAAVKAQIKAAEKVRESRAAKA